jgi:3'-phosphoadenosine 5'-phosphosulfate synthase
MRSIVSAKILGSMELIDEGETDHKIIVLRATDSHFDEIDSARDLERFHPAVTAELAMHKNYKTSEGKLANRLLDEPATEF